jgi:hypothetical protein
MSLVVRDDPSPHEALSGLLLVDLAVRSLVLVADPIVVLF